MARLDLTGQVFGRLTAVCDVGYDSRRNRIWEFSCSCGNTTKVTANSVKSGNTTSCGCAKIEATSKTFTTHGATKTPEGKKAYSAWTDIKRKCYDENAREYVRYGAKGRKMFAEWLEHPALFCDYILALPNFSFEMTLDRVDNEVGYFPGNLRWATHKQQAHNRCLASVNTSGKNCVAFRVVTGNTYATCQWKGLDGKHGSKTFSVKKFGLLPAFAMACKVRDEVIAELNAQGAGYTENHGK